MIYPFCFGFAATDRAEEPLKTEAEAPTVNPTRATDAKVLKEEGGAKRQGTGGGQGNLLDGDHRNVSRSSSSCFPAANWAQTNSFRLNCGFFLQTSKVEVGL